MPRRLPWLLVVALGCAPPQEPTPTRVAAVDCLHDATCGFPFFAAHRGKCGDVQEPENTLASYLACAAAGVMMVEVDIRVSADGQVVLNHDADLERTTDVVTRFPGRTAVSQLTLAELQSLVVTDPRCDGPAPEPSRCRVASLAELLDAPTELTFFIDYKSGALEPFFELVRARKAERRILFFDASLDVLGRVHAALPGAALMPRVSSAEAALALLDATTLPIGWIHGDPPYVKELAPALRARGVRLYANVWHLDAEFLIVESRPAEEQAAHLKANVWPKLRAALRDGQLGFGTEYAGPMLRELYPAGWGVLYPR